MLLATTIYTHTIPLGRHSYTHQTMINAPGHIIPAGSTFGALSKLLLKAAHALPQISRALVNQRLQEIHRRYATHQTGAHRPPQNPQGFMTQAEGKPFRVLIHQMPSASRRAGWPSCTRSDRLASVAREPWTKETLHVRAPTLSVRKPCNKIIPGSLMLRQLSCEGFGVWP